MELNGLSSNTTQLGEAAGAAMTYVSSHIRSHYGSLKVQTSKGNYLNSLSTLSIRTEQMNFQDKVSWERNIDDLILRTPTLQNEHWFDRSAMLMDDGISRDTTGAVKVVLLSLDRNVQFKSQLRQLPAASEKDLAIVLATWT
jgi:protein SMG6